MRTWSVRLDVLCESKESALAYANQVHEALISKQLRLPKGYKMAQVTAIEGDWEPNQDPGHRVDKIAMVDGGIDG